MSHSSDLEADGLWTACKELLSGSAFFPHPLDFSRGLWERLGDTQVLLVVLARDRAAIMAVHLGSESVRRLSPARQIAWKQEQDLVSALKKEQAAHPGIRWVLGVVSLSWQVQFGKGTSRSLDRENDDPVVEVLRNSPERFISKLGSGQSYCLVEHPILERSLVFGCRDAELLSFADVVRASGLRLASIRIGMAALVEAWLKQGTAEALAEDVLFCDGLGLLLLQAESGDWVQPPPSADGSCSPRHVSNRPNDLQQDMIRLLGDRRRERLRFVGPREFAEQALAQAQVGGFELLVDPLCDQDLGLLPVRNCLRHEMHPEARRRRAPLSARHHLWSRLAIGFLCLFLLAAGLGLFVGQRHRGQTELCQLRERSLVLEGEQEAASMQTMEHQLGRALVLRNWLETHPHAQAFLGSFLQSLPNSVTLVKVSFQLEEGGRQMSLEFSLKGSEAALVQASRQVEEELVGIGFRIGERQPVLLQPQAASYRWRLLMPVGKEELP